MASVHVQVGNEIDFDQSSKLFQKSYPKNAREFTAEYFKWRYTQCFGADSVLIGLYQNDLLIGQAVIFIQCGLQARSWLRIGQLADLVVHPEYRSIHVVRTIYRALKSQIEKSDFDFVFTLPNAKSVKFNQHFLNMYVSQSLTPNLSIGWPKRSQSVVRADVIDGAVESIDLPNLDKHLDAQRLISWTKTGLEKRLADPSKPFGVVSTDHSTMITTIKQFGRLKVVLVMGLFCAGQHIIKKEEWKVLINASTQMFRNPVHVYFGTNEAVEKSAGLQIPFLAEKLTKNIQVLQMNDRLDPIQFSNLELIDLDIY